MTLLQQPMHLNLDGFGEEIDWDPRRLVLPGPWSGHIPFAYWLMKAAHPKLLVELGTHTGNSFSAFCQAVDTFKLPTRTFAVDTWQGDEHAGHYNNEVLQDLSAFVTANYASFATLLPCTFDEAIAQFMPKTVDVLHIDGMHTYEAVRHDYLTWFDMLSDEAIVLFHDTHVREREFGVWKLWQELSEDYPAFEFTHSNGLGVLGVGKNLPPAIRRFFELVQDEKAAWQVRDLFARRGRRFELTTEVMALQNEMARLQDEKATVDAANSELGLTVNRAREQVEAHQEHLNEVRAHLQKVEQDLQLHKGEIDKARKYQAELEARLNVEAHEPSNLRHALKDAQHDLARKDAVIDAKEKENLDHVQVSAHNNALIQDLRRQKADLARTIDELHNSTSWRVTKPLRLTSKAYNRFIVRKWRAAMQRLNKPKTVASVTDQATPLPATEPSSLHGSGSLRDAVRGMMMGQLDAFLDAGGSLHLPRSEKPDVSIILVLYNQAEMTYSCLSSIKEFLESSRIDVETIIFDNGSSDKTHALLDRIVGATVIKNDANLHFLRGVNTAAEHARGRHILLLNNDTKLTAGSLEAAVETLDRDPTIGAVGGRLILPDGTLQEAGSIIWSDGSCLGYGRGQKPDNAEFMFQRDVDYCSGAFLLTPRSLFERLGRLDVVYAPAYYEETDYCVRVWKENLRVVYNPKIVIHHFEFASSTKVGDAIALQERNLATFRKHHADWLSKQYSPSLSNVLRARQHRSERPKLLFIEDQVPKSWLGSGFPRSADIIKELFQQGFDITLFPTAGQPERWVDVWKEQPLQVETVLPQTTGVDLGAFLKEREGYYDGVFVTRPHNMEKLRKTLDKHPGILGEAALIYDAEALFAAREILKKELEGNPIPRSAQKKLVDEELALTRGCDLLLSVSPAERQIMTDHGLENVHVLGHMVHLDPTTSPFETRTDIVFLGAVHTEDSPNADSIRWFANDVLPTLRTKLQNESLRLKVIGLIKATSLQALDGDSLELVGPVDDLKRHFESARVVVVPTRFAAGIPHKVHHVASHGVPIVATDLIAGQLGWVDKRDLLHSSTAEGFANSCFEAYTDADLWEQLRLNSLERVSDDCSPDRFRSTLQEVSKLILSKRQKTDAST